MSVTEELRRLLDERGVEWRKPAQEYWVLLGMPEGDSSTIVGELSIEEATDGTLVAYNLTPAQAIAATLGRGECHEVKIDRYWRGCGECGYIWEHMYAMGKCTRPNFCPNCGAKVVTT